MSDTRPSYEDQLPWLQAVDDEDEPRGISARKMGAALVVLLLAVLIVAATFFWLGSRDAVLDGPPELIQAEPGPYKIKPPNPGGLDVAGESETAFETSAGEDKDSQLDLSKVPETAVVKPPKEQPVQHLPSNETKVPVDCRACARTQAFGRGRKRGSAWRLCQPGAGRAGMDRAIGAFPDRRRDEQADRPLPGRDPASRRRGFAGRRQGGVPDA